MCEKPPCREISPDRWTLFVCFLTGMFEKALHVTCCCFWSHWPTQFGENTNPMYFLLNNGVFFISQIAKVTHIMIWCHISVTLETFTTCGSTGETHNRQVIWGWWLWRKKKTQHCQMTCRLSWDQLLPLAASSTASWTNACESREQRFPYVYPFLFGWGAFLPLCTR